MTLGKSVGEDKKVAAEVSTFTPTDTIYASIETTGSASYATLMARWKFVPKSGAAMPVKEDTLAIAPTGGATTEFHIRKPDGWPIGDYFVNVLLDGKLVATKAFRVAG